MMKNFFLTACCFLFLAFGCEEDYQDPLGDLIINLKPSGSIPGENPLLNNLTLGLFPAESLVTNTFTSDLAFQAIPVDLKDERAVFTNILPGTYVVAFVATSSQQTVPKQVVQITADDVVVADLYF